MVVSRSWDEASLLVLMAIYAAYVEQGVRGLMFASFSNGAWESMGVNRPAISLMRASISWCSADILECVSGRDFSGSSMGRISALCV